MRTIVLFVMVVAIIMAACQGETPLDQATSKFVAGETTNSQKMTSSWEKLKAASSAAIEKAKAAALPIAEKVGKETEAQAPKVIDKMTEFSAARSRMAAAAMEATAKAVEAATK